jgi:hypothetical protein
MKRESPVERPFLLNRVPKVYHYGGKSDVICVPLASNKEISVGENTPSDTFKKVLVPIDLSESSLNAIPLAMRSVQPGGEIRLLHVVKPGRSIRAQHRRTRKRRSAARNKLAETLKTLTPSRSGKSKTKLKWWHISSPRSPSSRLLNGLGRTSFAWERTKSRGKSD